MMNIQTESAMKKVKKVVGCAVAILLLGGWQAAAAQNSNTLGASAKVLQNIVVGNTTKLLSFGRFQVNSGKFFNPDSPIPTGLGGVGGVTISGNSDHRGYASITFVNGEEFALEITAPEYLDHTDPDTDARVSFTLENEENTEGTMLGLITQTDVPNNEDSEFTAIPGGGISDFTVDRSGTDIEVWSTGTTPGNGVTMPGSTVYLVLGGWVDDNVELTSTAGNYAGTIQIKTTIIN